MTINSPNPVDGDVQALNELVAALYPQYGTPGSRDVEITARRKVIDQSAAAIFEAFRELQQEKSRLEDIARHANRGWKHAYETTKRAEAAEVEILRLNATAQPVSDGLYRIANHIAGAKNSLPQEWQDWAEEIESDLRKLSAAKGGQDEQ